MNFNDAVAQVISITARPDKSVSATLAVNEAITFACSGTDFARDLDETLYTNLTPTAYSGNIQLSALPRFRKIQYIKASDSKKILERIDATKIFLQNKQRTDCYYIAGSQINFSICSLAPTFLIGYYQYPPVLSGSDTFWLLDVQPWMIINKAASLVFSIIGDDASMKQYDGLFRQQYVLASRDLQYG